MAALTMVEESQMMSALGTANGSRFARSELKRRLKACGRRDGALFLAEVLSHPPVWLRSAYVFQVVQWVPTVGDHKAARMLKMANVDPWRKVGRLTERQGVALVMEFRRLAAHEPDPRVRPARSRTEGSGVRVLHCCRGCGSHMRVATQERLCGFCIEEGLS